MESEKYGVMATLHDCALRLRTKGCTEFAADLEEAMAAVAELIEADKEFDLASDGYNPLFAKEVQYNRHKVAKLRRAAALERVGIA